MPRTARAAVGGYCYHAMNHAFVGLMRQATACVGMRVIGYCVMPNHFHCVLWPRGDDDMARGTRRRD